MENKGKSWSGLIFAGLMIAIASFLVGGYGGSQLSAVFLVDQGLNKDARAVQAQVKTLQHLQAGETRQAIELLESRLDDNLILFDPNEPYQGLSDQTQADIERAINQARTYRRMYPRKSGRSYVDEAVNNLFKKHE